MLWNIWKCLVRYFNLNYKISYINVKAAHVVITYANLELNFEDNISPCTSNVAIIEPISVVLEAEHDVDCEQSSFTLQTLEIQRVLHLVLFEKY
jgi:hypothetical protein